MRWGSKFSWNPIFIWGGGVRRWVCFWMHFFFANFWTFSLYPYTPSPLEEGGGGGVRGGYGWVSEGGMGILRGGMKKLSKNTQISSHPPPIPPPTPPSSGEGGGVDLGDGYVFGCICLQIFEHFPLPCTPVPPWRRVGVGWVTEGCMDGGGGGWCVLR